MIRSTMQTDNLSGSGVVADAASIYRPLAVTGASPRRPGGTGLTCRAGSPLPTDPGRLLYATI